jgi:hypothetical protein
MEGARFQASPKRSDFAIAGRISCVTLLDGQYTQRFAFQTGCELRLRVELSIDVPISSVTVAVCILDLTRQIVCEFNTVGETLSFEPGKHIIDFYCAELPLQPGVYNIDAAMEDTSSFGHPDWQRECASLYVERGKPVRGVFYTPHTWTLTRSVDSNAIQSVSNQG